MVTITIQHNKRSQGCIHQDDLLKSNGRGTTNSKCVTIVQIVQVVYDKYPWAWILPSQPQWSKLPEKTWKVETYRTSDKHTRMYSCVAHHHHEDHNIRIGWEHDAKKTPNRKQHGKDGFYMNLKANRKPYIMKSLNRPQSRGMDSTRIPMM